MKIKIIYVSFIVLAVVLVAISFFTSKETMNSQKVLQENAAPVVIAESRFKSAVGQKQSVVYKTPGIVIIKSATHEKTLPPEIKEAAEESSQVKSPLVYGSAEKSVDSLESEELIAGIERINKFPTKERVKEMNEKGIVIY